MPHDPRYSKTTPAPPWGQPPNDPTVSSTHTVRIAQPRSQPREAPMDTDPSTTPPTGDSAALSDAEWDNELAAELAKTCRVLTELVQQLTNAMQHVAHRHSYYPLEVREALAAAAELGITPKDQP